MLFDPGDPPSVPLAPNPSAPGVQAPSYAPRAASFSQQLPQSQSGPVFNINGALSSGGLANLNSTILNGLNQQYAQYGNNYANFLKSYGDYSSGVNNLASNLANGAYSTAAAVAKAYASRPTYVTAIPGQSSGSQGPVTLGQVNKQWADWYQNVLAPYHHQNGLFLAELGDQALATKLRDASNGGAYAGYMGAQQQSQPVFNPYLPSMYDPSRIGVRPLSGGSADTATNVEVVPDSTATYGPLGPTASLYNGGIDMGRQTDSPGVYSDDRSATFNQLPPNLSNQNVGYVPNESSASFNPYGAQMYSGLTPYLDYIPQGDYQAMQSWAPNPVVGGSSATWQQYFDNWLRQHQ